MEDGRANFGTPETLWLMSGYSSGVSVEEAQLTERALAKLAEEDRHTFQFISTTGDSV